MSNRARTSIPVALSAVVGVTAAGLMFVPRGDAAPPSPTSFSAEVTGSVWRVNKLDADPSDNTAAQAVGLAVGQVQGRAGSVLDGSLRAVATARNLQAQTAPAGSVVAESTATATKDPASPTAAGGTAGTVPGGVTYAKSGLSSRARWTGDGTCLPASDPMTSSMVGSEGSATVPVVLPAGTPPLLPVPVPTSLPSEFPSDPPSDFPTELPTDLPLPTVPVPSETNATGLPTDLPTSDLPTGLPTDLPTDIITSLLPTDLLPKEAQRAEGDVVMASVGMARMDQKSFLQTVPGTGTGRRVYAESVATQLKPADPVMSFFGGEAVLRMTGTPTLSAYSQGGTNGSQVTWTPPTMTLGVGSDSVPVPADGSALALPWSGNEDVVLTVSAGRLSTAESPTGGLAQAAVSVLNVLVKHGDNVLLDAELFPMALKVVAPEGGIDCSLAEPSAALKPGLTLAGKDNGAKKDKLAARAIGKAAGAKAVLFKVSGKKLVKVGSGKLDRKGDRTFTVKDKNGTKPTSYVVKVAATDLTRKATAKDKVR